MKKYIIVMSILFIFIFPSVALSYNNDVEGFDASTYPQLPECPYYGDNIGYVMDYYNDSAYSTYPYWHITYYEDYSKLSVRNDNNNNIKLFNNKSAYKSYTAYLKYDSVLKIYYYTDWSITSEGSGSNTEGFINYMSYWSHDLVSYYSGELVYESNPFPIPPVVLAELAGEQLQLIQTLIGGTAQEVLPLGLKVLVIILVISLVVYLLRSWLLRRV